MSHTQALCNIEMRMDGTAAQSHYIDKIIIEEYINTSVFNGMLGNIGDVVLSVPFKSFSPLTVVLLSIFFDSDTWSIWSM